jgi:hypothetical protein
MIIHTVVFKIRHPKESAEEQEFLRDGTALGKLPMVQNFHCFRQVSIKNNFEFGFSMEFASQKEYDAYNQHPEHVRFVETRWKPEIEDFLEIDYVTYNPSRVEC